MQPGDIVLTGIHAQALLSRAIKLTGQRWCSGWASMKVLDVRGHEAGLVGSRNFKIHARG
jgi:hypothetical protein